MADPAARGVQGLGEGEGTRIQELGLSTGSGGEGGGVVVSVVGWVQGNRRR